MNTCKARPQGVTTLSAIQTYLVKNKYYKFIRFTYYYCSASRGWHSLSVQPTHTCQHSPFQNHENERLLLVSKIYIYIYIYYILISIVLVG